MTIILCRNNNMATYICGELGIRSSTRQNEHTKVLVMANDYDASKLLGVRDVSIIATCELPAKVQEYLDASGQRVLYVTI
jgi:hypothetical protein